MKKLLLILTFAILFVSCSSSDDNSKNNSHLNPPNWIQGTWAVVYTDPVIIQPFCKFTSDNFCTIASNQEICLTTNEHTTVTQNPTDASFSFSYTTQGQTSSFTFRKITDTEIEYINPTQGLPNLTLEKQ